MSNSTIETLSVENVRCFAGKQTVQLRPITLLVGENNAGKSTFLGCLNAFVRTASFIDLSDESYFDQSPFRMGPFSTLTRHGTQEFAIEGMFKEYGFSRVEIAYGEGKNGEPEERKVRLEPTGKHGRRSALQISRVLRRPHIWRCEGPGFIYDLDRAQVPHNQISTWLSRAIRYGYYPFRGSLAMLTKSRKQISKKEKESFSDFLAYLQTKLRFPTGTEPVVRVESLDAAPSTRNRYESSSPLGNDDRPKIKKYLAERGQELGLFSGIRVKKRDESKYELQVQIGDAWINTIDAGYGIHSILPLLRIFCNHSPGTTFLLQQPEIHLHPVAQAALAQIMAEGKHRFVVETHSDYIIDRLRILVMAGEIEPDHVGIAYFEYKPGKNTSTIHNISIDSAGNLIGAPRSYQEFSLQEADRLLGFEI